MSPCQDGAEARWREGLAQLRAYTCAHDGTVPHTRLVVEGFPLGRWAARQRERYWANRLSLEQRAALEVVSGWEWGRTQTDRWTEGLTHLRSYVGEHGHAAVDTVTVHEGFALGGWVARRRANYRHGTLSPARAAALAALPGWTWTRTEDQWPPGLKALRFYIAKHGTAAVPADTIHRRYPLGRWVAARRAQYKRGTLSPEQITTLQDLPGWVWDVLEDRWGQGLRLLIDYAQRTGAPNPDAFYSEEAEDGFTLGAWVNSRRKEHRAGRPVAGPGCGPGGDPGVGVASFRRRLVPHVPAPAAGGRPARNRRPPHPAQRRRRRLGGTLDHGPTQCAPPRSAHRRPHPSPGGDPRLELGAAHLDSHRRITTCPPLCSGSDGWCSVLPILSARPRSLAGDPLRR